MKTVLYTNVSTCVWNIYEFALTDFISSVSYINAYGEIEINTVYIDKYDFKILNWFTTKS